MNNYDPEVMELAIKVANYNMEKISVSKLKQIGAATKRILNGLGNRSKLEKTLTDSQKGKMIPATFKGLNMNNMGSRITRGAEEVYNSGGMASNGVNYITNTPSDAIYWVNNSNDAGIRDGIKALSKGLGLDTNGSFSEKLQKLINGFYI